MRKHIDIPLRGYVVALALTAAACSGGDGAKTSKGTAVPRQSTGTLATAQKTASHRSFAAASAVVFPGASCRLHPEGSTDPAESVPVLADDDGVARFQTVRATVGDTVQRLALDCTDSTGKPSTYSVDLTAEKTFASRVFDPALATTKMRPALQGDPLGYSESELIKAGYGLRPDPTMNPRGYARWLNSATRPARALGGKPLSARAARVTPKSAGVTTTTAPNWVGSVLTGSTSLPPKPAGAPAYVVSEASFDMPEAIPSGDSTGNTAISVWNGLGGFGTGGGLIQGGVQLFTSPTSASYIMFREYCCGSPVSNNYTATFTPAPHDSIYSEHWYCDANGSFALNGGYGCSFIQDITQNAYFTCVSPTDTTCASVPALPGWVLGQSADWVIELETGPAFTDFWPVVSMSGSAGVIYGGGNLVDLWQDLSSDPQVYLLTDFTANQPTNIRVNQTNSDTTVFSMACVPTATMRCGAMHPGDALFVGDTLSSPDGRFTLIMQGDSNLVLLENGVGPLWATNTAGFAQPVEFGMGTDGSPILMNADTTAPYWMPTLNPGFPFNGDGILRMQNDGNLVLYRESDGTPFWASNTCCH